MTKKFHILIQFDIDVNDMIADFYDNIIIILLKVII